MKWQNQNESVAKGLFGSGIFRRIFLTGMTMLYSQLVLLLWYINKHNNGSFTDYYNDLKEDPTLILAGYISPCNIQSQAWLFMLGMFVTGLTLMKVVPGMKIYGPVTPTGHIPEYKDNGIECFMIHISLFLIGGMTGWYKLSIVYDYLGDILNALNYFAILFTLFLYFKGIYYPSTKDSGTSGNPLFDYYWGTELYPRIMGWDVKQFTNCRFGMMYWAIATISCASASRRFSLYDEITMTMLSTLIPQMLYIAKFFIWEDGYFKSIDIMQDRAGYYIVWGCLVYLPVVYTSMSVYMVSHPWIESILLLRFITFMSLLFVYLNYDADRQRQEFRHHRGNYKIWGKQATFIRAKYTTDDGTEMESLLLTSGWWGVSRHCHYIFEILAAFFWSCGSGFDSLMPFFYVIYLTVLLFDRSVRDDERCRAKYGKYWDEYCKKVPYKIIPYIF